MSILFKNIVKTLSSISEFHIMLVSNQLVLFYTWVSYPRPHFFFFLTNFTHLNLAATPERRTPTLHKDNPSEHNVYVALELRKTFILKHYYVSRFHFGFQYYCLIH